MCKLALSSESLRQKIAKAGQQRLKRNGHLNEIILNQITITAGGLL